MALGGEVGGPGLDLVAAQIENKQSHCDSRFKYKMPHSSFLLLCELFLPEPCFSVDTIEVVKSRARPSKSEI